MVVGALSVWVSTYLHILSYHTIDGTVVTLLIKGQPTQHLNLGSRSMCRASAPNATLTEVRPLLMRKVAVNLVAIAAALTCSGAGINAFTTTSPISARKLAHSLPSACMLMSSSSNDSPVLVNHEAFVRAIDILKNDMGMEVISEGQRPMYAIGKLVARLPLELASGIRFADCETLTLISQLKESVVDETGMQSLDTIVAIRAGGDGRGGYGYVGSTNGASIADTAQAYTDAIKYAMQNNLKEIELEVNRLVPLIPTTE